MGVPLKYCHSSERLSDEPRSTRQGNETRWGCWGSRLISTGAMGERRGGTTKEDLRGWLLKMTNRPTDHTHVVLSPLTFTIEFVEGMTRISSIVCFIDIVDRQLIASYDELRYFTSANRWILKAEMLESVHHRSERTHTCQKSSRVNNQAHRRSFNLSCRTLVLDSLTIVRGAFARKMSNISWWRRMVRFIGVDRVSSPWRETLPSFFSESQTKQRLALFCLSSFTHTHTFTAIVKTLIWIETNPTMSTGHSCMGETIRGNGMRLYCLHLTLIGLSPSSAYRWTKTDSRSLLSLSPFASRWRKDKANLSYRTVKPQILRWR